MRAPPHGFSQLATSFIACPRQGIPRVPLLRLTSSTASLAPRAWRPGRSQALRSELHPARRSCSPPLHPLPRLAWSTGTNFAYKALVFSTNPNYPYCQISARTRGAPNCFWKPFASSSRRILKIPKPRFASTPEEARPRTAGDRAAAAVHHLATHQSRARGMSGTSCPKIRGRVSGGRRRACFRSHEETYSLLQKGGDPAAGSPTATLLRLRPSHRTCLRPLPPCG
jgi:hypothetical protein